MVGGVRCTCVIVHTVAGRRANSASSERPSVRSVLTGPCDMEGTSAFSNPRKSLRRSRESRSAAGAGNSIVNDTVVVLKVRGAFRKSDKDLRDASQPVSSFNRCLAITIRCISDVPSPISQIFASRIIRSTG